MLKKRIAANLVVRNGIVVQSIGFKKYLPVGRPEIAIEFLNKWGIDEIILTDISATRNGSQPDMKMVRHAAQKCFVPLTIGGGITNVDQVRELLQSGADKISLNQAAIHQPELITKAAHVFGDQCVVVSIDAIKTGDKYLVYDYLNAKALDISVENFARECQEKGAGEILINSVDRDGSYQGYDIELIQSVCGKVTVPVICCGGARNAADFISVFKQTGVSAASAANFFHFTEHSVNITKANILSSIEVRLETHASYQENGFDSEYRLKKKSDKDLEEMLFVRIEKEII